MITYKNGFIVSNLSVTSFLGHSGGGMWPYIYYPPYQLLLWTIRKTRTTVHSKSISWNPIIGNVMLGNIRSYMKVVKKTEDGKGMLNAIGLTNLGAQKHVYESQKAVEKGFQVVHSYAPIFKNGIERAVDDILCFIYLYRTSLKDKFKVIEIDASCLTSESIIDNMHNVLVLIDHIKPILLKHRIALAIKLSYLHPYEFGQALENKGVDSLTAINTIPYDIIYPGKMSPLAAYGGGGVSYLSAFPFSYKYCDGLRKAVKIPINMGCGVGGEDQIKILFNIGADSVNFCSMAKMDMFRTIQLLRKYNQII
jgi:dihydroorotate dehydrogenase